MTETRLPRYEVVAQLMENKTGSLLDAGARDRILSQYLPATLQYFSSDMGDGHDYQWNMEQPAPFADGQFDYVIGMEVLEHVESIQAALRELVRIARREVIITLPNMSCLTFRLTFMFTGRLSGKYDLGMVHPGDRHRWLTIFDQNLAFVKAIATEQGCTVHCIYLLKGHTRLQTFISWLPLPLKLKTYSMLFLIQKDGKASVEHEHEFAW